MDVPTNFEERGKGVKCLKEGRITLWLLQTTLKLNYCSAVAQNIKMD